MSKSYILHTDASDESIDACLIQAHNKGNNNSTGELEPDKNLYFAFHTK